MTPDRRSLLLATPGILLLATLLAAEDAPPPAPLTAPGCRRPLLARPDGSPVGCLEEGVPVRVEERVPGWYRVQVEGWLREAEAAGLPAPSGKASLAGTAVGAAGAAVGGAVIRLLPRADEFDRALASLRERHEAERTLLDRRLQEVDGALERALFSSDNLLEAKRNQGKLQVERGQLEQGRQALRRNGLQEASALFEQHQVLSTSSDASGFFLLEGIEPGSYRLLVTSGAPGDAPAWYLPITLEAGERRRIDLSTLREREDPFTRFD